jgi:hypothetical protein
VWTQVLESEDGRYRLVSGDNRGTVLIYGLGDIPAPSG